MRHENQTNNHIFFFCFLSPNCLKNSFLHMKIAKIHFSGVPPLIHSGMEIPEFWMWKLWDQNFVSFDLGNLHIEDSKKPLFNFSIELRRNSKIFRVISWPKKSHHNITFKSLLTHVGICNSKFCETSFKRDWFKRDLTYFSLF